MSHCPDALWNVSGDQSGLCLHSVLSLRKLPVYVSYFNRRVCEPSTFMKTRLTVTFSVSPPLSFYFPSSLIDCCLGWDKVLTLAGLKFTAVAHTDLEPTTLLGPLRLLGLQACPTKSSFPSLGSAEGELQRVLCCMENYKGQSVFKGNPQWFPGVLCQKIFLVGARKCGESLQSGRCGGICCL